MFVLSISGSSSSNWIILEALKTPGYAINKQVSFHCVVLTMDQSHLWLSLCFMFSGKENVFFQRKTEHRLIFLGLLKPFFLLKFRYGWKDLIESFPTSICFGFFGVMVDLLQFFKVFLKNRFF